MHPKPKKSLGQNFLINPAVMQRIVEAADIQPDDVVVEIGAGKGQLTGLLSGKAKKVYALEIDPDLCSLLRSKLKNFSNAEVIEQDVLSFSLERCYNGQKIKVVGNLPYYISTAIIERLIAYGDILNSAFFTLQKEFAQRIVATCGTKEYGALSCFVQYYAHPEILFFIKRGNFWPVPKVDSAFLKLDFSLPFKVRVKDEKRLFKIIREGFKQRRKILSNSLKGIIAQERLERFFQKYRINPLSRPEDLSLEDFVRLAEI